MLNNLNKLTEKIIGCAIEVHRRLGPGLLECIYPVKYGIIGIRMITESSSTSFFNIN